MALLFITGWPNIFFVSRSQLNKNSSKLARWKWLYLVSHSNREFDSLPSLAGENSSPAAAKVEMNAADESGAACSSISVCVCVSVCVWARQ